MMPYKVVGNKVMVHKNGRWVLFKAHKTHEEAVKQVQALYFAEQRSKKSKHK